MSITFEKKIFNVNFTDREGSQLSGPLSLLWELIEGYKVDIFEVKLSTITDDFIYYMKQNTLSLDDQSEFTVMAARLLFYKSKLLLPNPGFEEEPEEDHLPFELVQQLLEYKKFQQAADLLKDFEANIQKTLSREPSWNQYLPEETFLQVDLMSFLLVFKDFLEKQERKQPMEIEGEEIFMEDVMEQLRLALQSSSKISFFHYIVAFNVLKCVLTFMAVLELAKTQEIEILQDKPFADIYIMIKKKLTSTSEVSESN